MNKIIKLTIVLLSVTTMAFAQKNKVQTAWNYLKYDDLDKARTAIDEASVHETTLGSAKTWYYRGLIYQRIYKHEKFGGLDAEALEKALQSFKKALEIEPDYEFKPEINQQIQILGNSLFLRGVDQFNEKSYLLALVSFEHVLKISPTDTMAILNSAYSAERSGQKEKAKTYFNALISMKYNDPRPSIFLSGIQKSEGDTASALATIKNARKQFPADNTLIIEELNIYLSTGRDKEALESINLALGTDPNNASLYFARGTLFDKMNNKQEAAGSYKDAIAKRENYFDAYYNLGALYFNEGAELANKANDIPPNKIAEYDAAKKKFEAKFKDALPYLEKAHEIEPKDVSTMESLRQVYVRLGDLKKAEEIKSKLAVSGK